MILSHGTLATTYAMCLVYVNKVTTHRDSCSVFRYGRGFGLIPKGHWLNQPNSLFGIAFYLIQLLLGEQRVIAGQDSCDLLSNFLWAHIHNIIIIMFNGLS